MTDLGRRLEARPFGDHVRAAREDPALRGESPRRAGEGDPPRLADRVAHDQQVAADDHAVPVAIGRLVDEVVGDDEISGVEQVVEAADAGV